MFLAINNISSITTRRLYETLDVAYEPLKAKDVISLYKPTSNIKTISVSSARYERLDTTIPAVAFVNFSTSMGGLYITNSVPPNYVKSFTCKRVNNATGEFTLTLQCPIDTFNVNADDVTIKLINLFGHIDAEYSTADNGGESVPQFKCSLSYGWRNGCKTVIKYDSALITGLTLSYSGNYYNYTITGLINSLSSAGSETGVKLLSYEQLARINSENLSDAAKDILGSVTAEAPDAYSSTSNTAYRVFLPAGSTIYKMGEDSTGQRTITASTSKTTADQYFAYGNYQGSSNMHWTADNLYFYTATIRGALGDSTVDAYAKSDTTIQLITGSFDLSNLKDAPLDTAVISSGVDLTHVYPGERLSTKVEILANYLFGDLYTIEVAHTDKEYTEKTAVSTCVRSIHNDESAKSDTDANTLNESTTSLYTWLMHMIKGCQDNTESEAYAANSAYDVNSDGYIDKSDINIITRIDKIAIADKWKKHGISDYTRQTSRESSSNINAMAFKMTEAEFKKYFKIAELKPTQNIIGPMPATTAAPEFLTYEDYSADFDAYNMSNNTAQLETLTELIDNYEGGLSKGASAVQFKMYFMDSVAGKPAKIYIGPTRTDMEHYEYVIGNNAKHTTVQSFSTSENLVYLVSAVKAYVSASDNGIYRVDPSTGGIEKGTIDTSASQIDNKTDYAIKLANSLLDTVATGHLEASLTVLSDSVSRQVQVTDCIDILCKANGGKNMFSGSYTVMGVEDTLSESGLLTTTMKLQFTQSSAFDLVKNIILTHLKDVELTSSTITP